MKKKTPTEENLLKNKKARLRERRKAIKDRHRQRVLNEWKPVL